MCHVASQTCNFRCMRCLTFPRKLTGFPHPVASTGTLSNWAKHASSSRCVCVDDIFVGIGERDKDKGNYAHYITLQDKKRYRVSSP